jgi:predicted membrane-bound spermidine synthase
LVLDRFPLTKHPWRVPTEKPPQFFRAILFSLFFVSGFCGLLYQVIWTRMAFAAFGIITPVLSVVLSVFMLGLSVGSVLGGKWIPALTRRTRLSGAVFYALAEFLIGVGAYAVPRLFARGNHLLLAAGEMNSFHYLFLSACVLALSILPWCLCMGATFPLMMAYIREFEEHDAQSFSFLYTANVLGAMCGTFLTAIVFVELFGFHQTLQVAAAGNFCIALVSAVLGLKQKRPASTAMAGQARPAAGEMPATGRAPAPFLRWILFSTGFCAMAMEVVWTRAFIPVLKTQVYSFALIVFAYLGATFAGSWRYRHHLRKKSPWPVVKVMAVLVVAVYLPIVINDPRLVDMTLRYTLDTFSAILVLASICPFCAALGYLTPRLVDDYAGDDPSRAGSAYAINVAGCIVGPLFASYLLLPQMGEVPALLVLSLPFVTFYLLGWKSLNLPLRAISSAGACLVLGWALLGSRNFEDLVANISTRVEVRRDYAATVISMDQTNGAKGLLVNGIGMTKKTPVTKFMVDLPLTMHQGPAPQSALIICFGMGTSYRTALTWDIDTTAVELVPAVPDAFGFYYADAADVLSNPHGRIVIDDGRRFLSRTREQYDIVVIDPPPPVEAAGSSLLYSKEMCELVRQHLKPHGILQLWFPGGEPLISQAIVRSVADVFPHVRCFGSIEGWGLHILASNDPIEVPAPAVLAARMPVRAQHDLLEWFPVKNLPDKFAFVLSHEVAVTNILNPNPDVQITDDDPMNEYFLLRRSGWF